MKCIIKDIRTKLSLTIILFILSILNLFAYEWDWNDVQKKFTVNVTNAAGENIAICVCAGGAVTVNGDWPRDNGGNAVLIMAVDVKMILVNGGAGNDTIDLTCVNSNYYPNIELDPENVKVLAGAGNDIISGSQLFNYLSGGDGDDEIYGGPDMNDIFGGGGNDEIIGGASYDFIKGGPDNDIIHSSGGNDEVYGEAGDDIIVGGPGNDIISGGENNDQLAGSDGDDELFGDQGEDIINGNLGEDEIYGGDDNDNINGDEGNDYVSGGEGEDEVRGGAGDDDIKCYSGSDRVMGGDGNDFIDLRPNEDGVEVFGGAGNDEILGGYGDDELHGEYGNDIIKGNSGNDKLWGEENWDKIYGGKGADELYGGPGHDQLYYDENDTVIDGASGNDSFRREKNDKAIKNNTKHNYTLENQTKYVLNISDEEGIDTLNFMDFLEGISLDIDLQNSLQNLTLSGDQINLAGQFEHIVGTDFSDEITIDPLEDTPRFVDGGDNGKGEDILNFDGKGVVCNDDGSCITAEGYQAVTYTNIETCNITNIAGLTFEDNLMPKEYKLRQNYPNPFNPTTTIQFDLPESGYTSLFIFNQIGELVSQLINTELKAGKYNYEFDGTGLSSGIYYYRLTSGDYSETKKMVLLK